MDTDRTYEKYETAGRDTGYETSYTVSSLPVSLNVLFLMSITLQCYTHTPWIFTDDFLRLFD